jgi:hypothetical protein
MPKAIPAAIVIAMLSCGLAHPQDIAGLEDCTKTSGLDKRTGCFQANIEVLSRMIMKTAADAQQKVSAANGQIAAANAQIADLQRTLADLRTRIETLEKAAKKPDEKK